MPAAELFPVEEMAAVTSEVLEKDGGAALQYSATEGFLPLRKAIAERMNRVRGTSVSEENILITSGSQQGLDLSGKLFLNEGDVVLCESPTYIGAIGAYRVFRPTMAGVATDDDGMIIEDLERRLAEFGDRVKLIYVIPDFQNPTGRSWSIERRRALLDVASRAGVVVVEDSPYAELRFEGEIMPAMKSIDSTGGVLYLGTFSKIFCPGLRLAWIAADPAIIEKLVLIKQGTDLHTSSLAQRQMNAYLSRYDLASGIEKMRDLYRTRRDAMLDAMNRFVPEGVHYTHPAGGLFLWAELPNGLQARDLLERCLQRNVAFVPGGSFFVEGEHENTLRLSYSFASPEKITEGIKILGEEMARIISDADKHDSSIAV